jgi:hypothetical protein
MVTPKGKAKHKGKDGYDNETRARVNGYTRTRSRVS